jgi:hypothetical protein
MTTSPPAPARVPQAVTGVVPPQLGEGRIREAWPSLLGVAAGPATLGKKLVQSWVLTPIGWLVLAPLFALKFAPCVCKRYTLTNRRLMVRKGLRPAMVSEVPLEQIDDVRLDPAKVDPFFLSGTLEVISKGQVVMTLPGVPEPEGFRHAIINTVKAWVPSKATGPFQPASEVK